MRRRDRRFGEQVRAQEVSEGRRVDRIVVDPACGDRLGGQGMRHVGLDAGVGEQIGEPAPAIRRFEGHRDRLGLEFAEDAPERLAVVDEAAA